MNPLGDAHNFGKRVHRIDWASGSMFQKPRTLYWENIFFGMSSGLREAFEASSHPCAPLAASLLFNLDIQFQENKHLTGTVVEVQSKPNFQSRGDNFTKFGLLLGYCQIFGICDLHRENIIMAEHGMQVIDAEVVFSDLMLPQQTYLLPFKSVSFRECGLSHLVQSLEAITITEMSALLAGFVSMFDLVEMTVPNLKEIFLASSDTMLSLPIRQILRPTRSYIQKIYGDLALFDFEQIQCKRGDVPYFFKFLSNDKLYYYTSESGEFAPVEVPSEFRSMVNAGASDPIGLLEAEELQRKLVQSILSLGKLFYPKLSGTIDFGQSRHLVIEPNAVVFSTPNQNYRSVITK